MGVSHTVKSPGGSNPVPKQKLVIFSCTQLRYQYPDKLQLFHSVNCKTDGLGNTVTVQNVWK